MEGIHPFLFLLKAVRERKEERSTKLKPASPLDQRKVRRSSMGTPDPESLNKKNKKAKKEEEVSLERRQCGRTHVDNADVRRFKCTYRTEPQECIPLLPHEMTKSN